MSTVTRFAPSPNGFLHLGHGYSAWLNQRYARRNDGRYLLRIEDVDHSRARAEFEAAIVDDLRWLGLSADGLTVKQSNRLPRYRRALDQLREMGMIYRSFLTRSEIRQIVTAARQRGQEWPIDPDGSPHCPPVDRLRATDESLAKAAKGQAFAWRLNLAEAKKMAPPDLGWTDLQQGKLTADLSQWGDVVLAGKEQVAAYHLAVVVDDSDQSVSHVIRGSDLQAATAVHRLLQVLLDLPEPVYWHHDLLVDRSGEKLSKSKQSISLRTMRSRGISPAQIIQGFEAGELVLSNYLSLD